MFRIEIMIERERAEWLAGTTQLSTCLSQRRQWSSGATKPPGRVTATAQLGSAEIASQMFVLRRLELF